MKPLYRGALALTAVVACAASATGVETIGVTAGVQNQVIGKMGAKSWSLVRGEGLFQDENIITSKDSATQLLFRDETSLTVGPESTVVLDEFVYDPKQETGKIVLNATKGAFRFISGSLDPRSYQIKTPVATVGVRGTICEFLVDETTTPQTLIMRTCQGTCLVDGQPVPAGREVTFVAGAGQVSDQAMDPKSCQSIAPSRAEFRSNDLGTGYDVPGRDIASWRNG